MIKLYKCVFSIGLKTMGVLNKIRQLEGDNEKETKKRKDPPSATHSMLRTDGVCIHAYTHSTHMTVVIIERNIDSSQ
jgi:hypothetical protein